MTSYTHAGILVGLAIGFISFISNYSHLLSSLLLLEFLSLMGYWWLGSSMAYVGKDFLFLLVYLVMWCGSGALGLCLLISGARSHGSDYMKMYSTVVC